MRTTSTVIAALLLVSSGTVLAHQARGGPEFQAARRAELVKAESRRAISEGLFGIFHDKRGEAWGREANGPKECGDEEDWVPYQQNTVVEEKEQEKPKEEEEKPEVVATPVTTPIVGGTLTTPANM